MDDLTKKLLAIKDRIEEAKTAKAQAEGRLSDKMEQLKRDFNCESVEQAEALLKKMEASIATKEAQLRAGVAELEGAYDWGTGA